VTPLLEIADLAVEIRRGPPDPRPLKVLNGVGFTAVAGEILGIVGESGAGKSLTVRSALGLLPPAARVTAGRAIFGGRDLLACGEAELARIRGREIAIVVQNPKVSLDPLTRVGDQVARLAMRHRGLSRAKAREEALALLDSVGIRDAARRARSWPHEMSGGMAQRVMIAMALVNAPRLLIADEPTTGLDPSVQVQVLDLIAATTRARGLGCILVSHDLGVIANYCRRVEVMFAGAVVESGTVAQVFGAPRHPYTRQLLAAARGEGAGRIGRLPPPDLAALPAGCAYRDRCPEADARCALPPPEVAPHPGQRVRCHRVAEALHG
jgi:peptide/nickel transport system ATP-binding protein/oligopeptide transport system ATP-binding protein